MILAPGFQACTKIVLLDSVSDFGLWHWQCPRSMFPICSSLLPFLWVPLCCSAMWDMGGLSSTSSCIVLHLPRIYAFVTDRYREMSPHQNIPFSLLLFILTSLHYSQNNDHNSFQWDRLKQSLCCSNFDLIFYQDFPMTLSTCLLAFSLNSTFI